MEKDYYNVLGVDKGASQEEIKKAYLKKAHQHHPDKGGDAEKFKEINQAYQVLGKADKRQQYDQFGSSPFSGQAGAGFGGFQSANFSGINFDDLGDMFGGFGDWFGFGGSSNSSGQRSSGTRDLEMLVELDFMEAAFGVEKEITYQRQGICQACQGTGAEPGSKMETCRTCQGQGKINRVQRTILGNVQMQSVCPDCQGKGQRPVKVCQNCRGSGLEEEKLKFKVKIPAGIDNGESIRLPGKGEVNLNKQAGDLYLRVRVKPHKKFERQGSDLKSEEFISYSQAAGGDKIEVETIHGLVKLKIPEGTQSGTVFRLKEKALPRLNGRGKGDHFVLIKIKVPKGLSKKQKKLLEEAGI
jgi:molecular chaperone DnaJ